MMSAFRLSFTCRLAPCPSANISVPRPHGKYRTVDKPKQIYRGMHAPVLDGLLAFRPTADHSPEAEITQRLRWHHSRRATGPIHPPPVQCQSSAGEGCGASPCAPGKPCFPLVQSLADLGRSSQECSPTILTHPEPFSQPAPPSKNNMARKVSQ